jgi:hypothetical protein
MQSYCFSYKKFLWFKKLTKCIGHRLDEKQDKMVIFFQDGSLREICNWSKCEIRLGADWVLWTKTQMEKESGTSVKMNVES